MYPPFSGPGSRQNATDGGQMTLPSIQDFLDELPPIESFAPDEGPPFEGAEDEHAGAWFEQAEFDAEGWAVAGWQSFDWTGAAALGVRPEERSEAAGAWDTLDWSAAPLAQQSPAPGQQKDVPPSADEVARALDGIARRIRSGELVIDQHSGTPPEAAMAAALAALLRKRD